MKVKNIKVHNKNCQIIVIDNNEPNWKETLNNVLDLAKQKGLGALLRGGVGTGKTSMINEWTESNYSKLELMTININDIENYYQDAAASNKTEDFLRNKGLKGFMTKWNQTGLFIDDIGSETSFRSYGNSIHLVNSILKDNLDTEELLYCTSNLDFEEINSKYGPRVFDRLKEKCIFISLQGKSFRGETSNKIYDELYELYKNE